MANYVKSTNFTSKDSLPTGDPLKVVKGTEIDVEFNNIATAVASKADSANPTFTGTPFAPTASPGTNTTQLATTAFVKSAIDVAEEKARALFPVGSVYINASNSTNPSTLLGFGTWVAFGSGRVLVGFNAADPLFDTAEETGGSKDAIVVSHTHTNSVSSAGNHAHSVDGVAGSSTETGLPPISGLSLTTTATFVAGSVSTSTAGAHTHDVTINSTGSSGTNANLQPYITVYMWKRTA
jgi:hypothetical protein